MMTLIIGGSGSGKSEYAENYVLNYSENMERYYIATMQVYDAEGQKKVQRHQKLREGKGFQTIEQPTRLQDVLGKMPSKENVALIECMSNLTANEMFSGDGVKNENRVIKDIADAVGALKNELRHLVIVSNNVFEDGIVYDETTMAYIRAMGGINEKLAQMADEVIEVVVGIPIMIKKV